MTGADMVNNPPHYGEGTYQVINVIEAWELGYRLGNVVKYVARAHRKGKQLEDLKKAAWYLQREIQALEVDKAIADAASEPRSCSAKGEDRTVFISVYTDIDKDPYKAFALNARMSWKVDTLAGEIAMQSKEWSCGRFGIEAGKAPFVWKDDSGRRDAIPGDWTVANMLRNFPADLYNYYLMKVGP